MQRNIAKNALWLFLLGLGDGLRVNIFGLISLSEIVVFVLAPLLFMRHQKEFQKAGFKTYFIMIGLMMVGTIASSLYNHTWLFASIKECATIYSIFAYSVVLFLLLKEDFRGIGWTYLGSFIASFIVIFAFNTALHMGETSGTVEMSSSTAEEVMSGVRFWTNRISAGLKLPIVGATYMQWPILYPFIALPLSAFACLTMSISGRADAAVSVLAAFLISVVGKSRRRMMIIGRHMFLFTFALVALAIVGKMIYTKVASSGYLGAGAQAKYFAQTKRGNSILSIIMAGRGEFFVGMRAVIDHPIMGFGFMAPDDNHYWEEFIWKYGDIEDYERYMYFAKQSELQGGVRHIPIHAYIVQFWGCSGIVGLVFCIYIFYLVYLFFKKHAGAVPHWYGFFACALPSLIWSMFFSPYGHGIGSPMLFTCLLMARAVGRGWLRLPYDMEIEARKYE